MFRRSASSVLPFACGSRAASVSLVSSSRLNSAFFARSYAGPSEAEQQAERERLLKEKEARIAKGLLELTLSAPHNTVHNKKTVKMVTIPAISGRMGVLAKHVPIVTPLSPGLVTVKPEEGKDEHYFISGGFATITPDSTCNVNSPEIVPIDHLNLEAAKKGVEEYTKKAAAATGKLDKATAEVVLSVYKEMVAAADLAAKGS